MIFEEFDFRAPAGSEVVKIRTIFGPNVGELNLAPAAAVRHAVRLPRAAESTQFACNENGGRKIIFETAILDFVQRE